MQPQTAAWTKATVTLAQSDGQLPDVINALRISEAIRVTSHVDLTYDVEIDPARMLNFTDMVGAFLTSEGAQIIWH